MLATGGLTGGGLTFNDAPRGDGRRAGERGTHTPAPQATGAGHGPTRRGGSATVASGGRRGRSRGGGGRVPDGDGETPLAPWLFAAGDVTVNRENDGLADASFAAGCRAGAGGRPARAKG